VSENKYKWPSREEWAKNVRTLYADQVNDVSEVQVVSRRLSDYGTPQEIAKAIAELEARWRAWRLGRVKPRSPPRAVTAPRSRTESAREPGRSGPSRRFYCDSRAVMASSRPRPDGLPCE
jgi:hypothetical protein